MSFDLLDQIQMSIKIHWMFLLSLSLSVETLDFPLFFFTLIFLDQLPPPFLWKGLIAGIAASKESQFTSSCCVVMFLQM